MRIYFDFLKSWNHPLPSPLLSTFHYHDIRMQNRSKLFHPDILLSSNTKYVLSLTYTSSKKKRIHEFASFQEREKVEKFLNGTKSFSPILSCLLLKVLFSLAFCSNRQLGSSSEHCLFSLGPLRRARALVRLLIALSRASIIDTGLLVLV